MSMEKTTNQLRKQCEDVLRLTQTLEPDLREIAHVAAENAEMTDRLLRAVNSVGSGLQHSISDVQHALAYLGTTKVTRIVEGMLPPVPPPPASTQDPTAQQTPHSRSHTPKTETDTRS